MAQSAYPLHDDRVAGFRARLLQRIGWANPVRQPILQYRLLGAGLRLCVFLAKGFDQNFPASILITIYYTSLA